MKIKERTISLFAFGHKQWLSQQDIAKTQLESNFDTAIQLEENFCLQEMYHERL